MRTAAAVLPYKEPFDDGSKPVQFGLISGVFPELVVYGEGGEPETVSNTCSRHCC